MSDKKEEKMVKKKGVKERAEDVGRWGGGT